MTGVVTSAKRSYRFDVRQFRRMMAAGIFDDQKVALVAGKIYVLTDLPPHTFVVENLHKTLLAMLPRDHWTIREEKPILIGRYWAPKPDIRGLRRSGRIDSRQPTLIGWFAPFTSAGPPRRARWCGRPGTRSGCSTGRASSSPP
jgi:hypothetical protein